jgi:hypothetical protein
MASIGNLIYLRRLSRRIVVVDGEPGGGLGDGQLWLLLWNGT